MTTTLIALHGFTQNGPCIREMLAPLLPDLPADLHIECPDAPNPCSEATIERMLRFTGMQSTPPPNRCWFDASDDGLEYQGLDATLAQLSALIASRKEDRIGLLGFSQGAILAASLAALSMHGKFPKLAYVVLVAGRTPRARDVVPLLAAPLALPSLHVCGERDRIAIEQIEPLAECFDAGQRVLALWDGPHAIPSRGPGAQAIARFVGLHHE